MAQYIQKPMKKKAGLWDMFNWTAPYASEAGSEMLEPLFKHERVQPGAKAVSRNGTILSRKQLDKITGADKLRAENKRLKGEVDFQTNRADDADADRIFADVTRGYKKPSAIDSSKEYLNKALEGMKGFAKAHPVGTGIAGGALAALVLSRIINGRKRRPKYAEAMTLKDRYSRGFATKCAAAGVDPNGLVRKVYLRNKILALSGVR